MSSQAGPVLDDQLESDRTRQFQEFLDDRVRSRERPMLTSATGNLHRCYQEHARSKVQEINCLAR
jgi:hypothetical protein